MREALPIAVWEGEFKIGGIALRCCVLDNGQRVINAEDFDAFFDAGIEGATEDEIQAFARWQKGLE